MAKQLLDTIRQAEQKAGAELEQTRAKADEMLAGRRAVCEKLERSRAEAAEARTAAAVAQAENDAEKKRENTLESYRSQTETLLREAGAKLPEAVKFVMSEVVGR